MVELVNGMDFHNFNLDCKPKEWYKRRSDESNVDWLKRVAIKDTNSLERYNERKRNRYWRQESLHFCFSVLSFLRKNNLSKEKMEEDLNMEIDLSNSYDYRLSEMCKIKNYMKDVNRSKL